MVRIPAEGLGHDLLQLGFDLVHILARREARAIADTEDMGVDREGLLAERRVQNDVGGLATDAGKLVQFVTRARDFASVIADQRLGKRDDVFRLGVEQANGLDLLAERFLPQLNHLLRGLHPGEQWTGRDVYAGIRRLGREDDGD